MPSIVQVASWARNNWHPFAFVKGSSPLYSNMVTSSDEAFALFLLKHYRSPPPEKEYKPKVKGPKYLAAALQIKHYKDKTAQQERW